jgi:nucleolar MIF4G domain-containing protein 1
MIGLIMLQPVDFTVLKPRTQEFLRELFIQIFINSQRSTPLVAQDVMKLDFTRNRNVVEEIFLKASRIQALAMGLIYFLSKTFQDNSGSDDGFSKFIYWAVGVAKDTLRTGIDVVTSL